MQEISFPRNKNTKKRASKLIEALLNKILAVPTFPVRLQTSILGVAVLTSVFGMGTGVSLQLYPPEIFKIYL